MHTFFCGSLVVVLGLVSFSPAVKATPVAGVAGEQPSYRETAAERFVADLHNPTLYEIYEGVYAGDTEYTMSTHVRKGLGWPQTATLVIQKRTGFLLMVGLFSLRDASEGQVTAVFMDDGFLRYGVPNSHLVRTDPVNSGTRFYKAYKWAKGAL